MAPTVGEPKSQVEATGFGKMGTAQHQVAEATAAVDTLLAGQLAGQHTAAEVAPLAAGKATAVAAEQSTAAGTACTAASTAAGEIAMAVPLIPGRSNNN